MTENKNLPNFAPEKGDMPKEYFRRYGYEVIDQIADYFEKLETFPVLSNNQPNVYCLFSFNQDSSYIYH